MTLNDRLETERNNTVNRLPGVLSEDVLWTVPSQVSIRVMAIASSSKLDLN